MTRALGKVVSVLALAVVASGCSSPESTAEQRLTSQRENYCAQLGAWQKARNAAGADVPESSEHVEVEAAAQGVLFAMRPLRDEAVGTGRTLAEATVAAVDNGDSEAEGRIVRYCGDVGFETLTR